MRSRLRALAILFLLALYTSVQGVRATTVISMDLDALVDKAGLIFTGTAVHREVVLSQDGKFPFTFITFHVDDELKGKVRDHVLTLRFHGGNFGNQVVEVVGTPEFEIGERYLLFVSDNGTTSFPVVGWRQGQYRFVREPRSGGSVLVDYQGQALGGIERGNWMRHAIARPEAPEVVLLGEEGIDVSELPATEMKIRPGRLPEAQEALEALRKVVRSRSGRATFLPSRFVESARPEDLPERVEWKPEKPVH